MEKNQENEISKTNRKRTNYFKQKIEYNTLNKCPSFIICNNESQILEYDDSDNHPESKFEAAKSIVKNKIKHEISNITRSRRKQLPPDIITFYEILNESKYYKHIFEDGTFYIAPIFSYQIFITRTYVIELICFYITSFSILKNKKHTTYKILFEEINKNSSKYNSIEITPKIFHFDFEKAISNVAKIFFLIKIKRECQEHNYVQFLEFIEEIKALVKYYKKYRNSIKKKKNVLEMISLNYELVNNFAERTKELKENIKLAIKKQKIKKKANNHHMEPPEFKSVKVWINCSPIIKNGSKKLKPIKLELFKVISKISLTIHPVIHVSELDSYYEYNFERNQKLPPITINNEEEEYEVEQILDEGNHCGKIKHFNKFLNS
ncbi:hypothetical protein H8356DRAFT_1336877 [Neocallimastix lanati (nom. inval.)]|nr:hypothetical protein H8356DRAFT_1336877 [Neocallimastix sp. JGI-2020a]